MEQRLFDCLNDAYMFTLSDPTYMRLIENDYNRMAQTFDSKNKVVYKNLTLTPGRSFPVDYENKSSNASYHFVVLARMEIIYDFGNYHSNLFYLCADYNHANRSYSPFWVCEHSYFLPDGRIYDKAAAVTLYSALATGVHDYTNWITNCLDDKMKSYTLFLMI